MFTICSRSDFLFESLHDEITLYSAHPKSCGNEPYTQNSGRSII